MIIDDEKSITNALKFAFDGSFEIYTANTMLEYSDIAGKVCPNIVLLDLKFGCINGLDILEHLVSNNKSAKVIMMTAYGTIETSILAIKKGAYDYIQKPLDLNNLKEIIEAALTSQALEKQETFEGILREENTGMIGNSFSIKKIFEQINRIKDVNVNVLIEGSSGTGKELVAHAIHEEGIRSAQPFIVINCAAIPQNLIESELFGYEKGAFTGAEKHKKGAFEMANRGSIFLDEIGEMDLFCQAKVLRVIQSKEVTPLGSSIAKKVDVRILSATNRNLRKEVEEGRFRRDLYYRLNVFPITIPPLNDRVEDIPLLVEHFIKKANSMYGMDIKGITNGAMKILRKRNYIGNVRELENIIYRACILCDDACIKEHCIQGHEGEEENSIMNDFVSLRLGSSLNDMEKQVISGTLNFVDGNKAKAAKLLGISERGLHYKLKSYSESK